MIIVTGATGQLGHRIVRQLAGRVPASRIGVSVRDPGKAADLAALGVRVRPGDFADPDSLPHAFEGATQVLIVSSNAAAWGGDPLVQHRHAIDAARAAGARRIVYTSHMAASDASAFPPMRDHEVTEDMLRDSGVAWTALRHGFYAGSGVMMMGDAFATGVVAAPDDGKVSWTAHADLAEADAIVLADEGRFDGPTPPLTGAEALDFTDLATLASGLLGKPVRRETLTDDGFRDGMTARGTPEGAAKIATGFFLAARTGEFAAVDPTLAQMLGRPPVAMRDVIAARITG